MRDAHTIRLTALYTALTMLGPEEITELRPITLQDLLDDGQPTALENATSRLIAAAHICSGASGMRLVRYTIKSTRWVQALIQGLGGIVVSDLLADAVVAAAVYQLSLTIQSPEHVSLDHVAAVVLAQANSPA